MDRSFRNFEGMSGMAKTTSDSILGVVCGQYDCFLVSPPGSDSLRSRLKFCCGFFFFSPRVISELRGPIAAKFCTMVLSMFDFIIPVQNFGGASQKKF